MIDSPIVVTDDCKRIGHALLLLSMPRGIVPRIALRFIDGTFLGPDGRRGRARFFFTTEAVREGACSEFRIGPEVTAHVREAEVVTFLDEDGEVLGTAAWEGIRVAPILGASARLGPSGARARGPARASSPSLGVPVNTIVPTTKPFSVTAEAERPVTPFVAKRMHPATVAAVCAFAALAIVSCLIVCVLAGLAGWRIEPTRIAFEGPQGGPFLPNTQRVKMEIAWYAKPFLSKAPVLKGALPEWIEFKQTPLDVGWSLDASLKLAADALAPGRFENVLPMAFPLHVVENSLAVSIVVDAPKSKSAIRQPASGSARPSIDDAVCDRYAGNRFDRDHPAAAGFTEEIFVLSQPEINAGLAACDSSLARTGADRRLTVQRGRLLAQRALLRLAAGDIAEAGSDMDQAVALWRHGDDLGSAYAANLLGAYYGGTFNRSGHVFVNPDDTIADGFWKKAMDGGNVVAQRNFAAQLLLGKGIPADPPRAAELLRDAADKGDLHAAGVLGVALFTGNAPGIAVDKATGWRLMVMAQCIDRMAAGAMERAIASGSEPASSRNSCH